MAYEFTDLDHLARLSSDQDVVAHHLGKANITWIRANAS